MTDIDIHEFSNLFDKRPTINDVIFIGLPLEVRIRLVLKYPDLIDELHAECIPHDAWRGVLAENSEYLSKAPWSELSSDTKVFILLNNPGAQIYIDWKDFDEHNWTELLAKRPEYYQFKPY